MWDTAGQEKFRSVAKSYFKNADGCIIVYDVNNRHTFKSIPYWLEQFLGKSRVLDISMPMRPILVLGNKTDLGFELKQIPTQELMRFSEEQGILFAEVSAKKNSGKQIQREINNLVDLMVSLSIFKLFCNS